MRDGVFATKKAVALESLLNKTSSLAFLKNKKGKVFEVEDGH